MTQLRQDYDEFRRRGAEVLAVGPEDSDAFRTYFRENDLPFPGLPDPSHTVLKRFGQEVSLFKLGRMPAQVVVDRQGIARFAHYGKQMSDIPNNQELLGLLDELNEQDEMALTGEVAAPGGSQR